MLINISKCGSSHQCTLAVCCLISRISPSATAQLKLHISLQPDQITALAGIKYFLRFLISNLWYCVYTSVREELVCLFPPPHPHSVFDRLIGQWTLCFYYSTNQNVNINVRPANHEKMWSSQTGSWEYNVLISGSGKNMEMKFILKQGIYKGCCKLVVPLSSGGHLHIFMGLPRFNASFKFQKLYKGFLYYFST